MYLSDWASWAAGLTPAQGALPLLYAAAAPDVEGQYSLPSNSDPCRVLAQRPRYACSGHRLLVASRGHSCVPYWVYLRVPLCNQ